MWHRKGCGLCDLCEPACKPVIKKLELLSFFLLLLTDADFGVEVLRVLESFVVVTGHGVCQVRVHIGIARQYSHY
jgi:hypothetical protein